MYGCNTGGELGSGDGGQLLRGLGSTSNGEGQRLVALRFLEKSLDGRKTAIMAAAIEGITGFFAEEFRRWLVWAAAEHGWELYPVMRRIILT